MLENTLACLVLSIAQFILVKTDANHTQWLIHHHGQTDALMLATRELAYSEMTEH